MPKNIEIELKLPLHNSDEVESYLKDKAKFKYESFQHDIYYNSPHRNFLENTSDVNEWLRVRIEDDGATITYKDWQPHGKKDKTHCIEFETKVSSYEQLANIMLALDFTKMIEVKKTRKAWQLLDCEVSIDTVEELGSFIEVEYKGESEDIEQARRHLSDLLRQLGAKTGELDKRGYPYLLLEAHKLI